VESRKGSKSRKQDFKRVPISRARQSQMAPADRAFALRPSPPLSALTFHTSTMAFTTTRDTNGTITISPRNEADQTATIVLCHGLGDSAQGWEDVAEVCC
jgi:hypothetical protein